ncbi:MAG: hypothetical protein ACT4OO_10610 [Nitrospiraceae bacterium]
MFAVILLMAMLFSSPWLERAGAAGFRSPEDCLAYSGDAHLNCLYAYIEIQQDTISKLQEELRTQKTTTQQFQNQVQSQKAVTEDLRRELRDRDQAHAGPQVYAGPLLGFGFGYSNVWGNPYYGPFPYGRRFFGPCYGFYHPCW